MADVHTPEQRSRNMSAIKGKDTKPEVLVRKFLFLKGFRFRKNDVRYPGKPDIVLPKYKTVIFVNGCFWHKHEGCPSFVWPKNNEEFWKKKIKANQDRDKRNYEALKAAGWNAIILWECQLKSKKLGETLDQLEKELTSLRN